jgi:lipoprotein-anchoring transpeptidase ErfK/SrfK
MGPRVRPVPSRPVPEDPPIPSGDGPDGATPPSAGASGADAPNDATPGADPPSAGADPAADAVPAAGPATGSNPAATSSSGRERLYLIGVAALVVVVLLGFLVVRARSEPDTVGATSTSVATTASTASSRVPLTEGSAPVGTEPDVVDTFPEAPIETFAPAEVVTAPPNTHQLPAQPFLVATPKNEGVLSVFPSAGAATSSQTLVNPLLVNNNPNAKVPLTLLVNKAVGKDWLEVFLPVRPNGSTGFVKTSDVTLSSHKYHIEVRLGAFSLKVFDGTNVIMDTKIAVAAANTPTPGGLYYTNMLLKPPDPNAGYGTYAYGLSGFSDVLKSFNNGPGQLGIHGGGDDRTIGHRVSHGCIRMRNSDIERLAPLLPLGVPVQIFA